MSRLDLVAGPNGAGKSTFVARILAEQLPGSPFVNADEIARRRWPDDPEDHAYEAAQVAEATRSALIESGEQFIAETVFSHPSKLALVDRARAAGYYVAFHVLILPEDVAVARVAGRVERGGHAVPETKIRERYRRLWPLVAEAAAMVQSADFWDNSTLDGPELVAELANGQLLAPPRWPSWSPEALTGRWAA
ncbi:MAG: zeta toxin family protein [Actinomycetota bacterium]|nr:zeta toxin family protein [Actinomycetota bacterium]